MASNLPKSCLFANNCAGTSKILLPLTIAIPSVACLNSYSPLALSYNKPDDYFMSLFFHIDGNLRFLSSHFSPVAMILSVVPQNKMQLIKDTWQLYVQTLYQ